MTSPEGREEPIAVVGGPDLDALAQAEAERRRALLDRRKQQIPLGDIKDRRKAVEE